MLETLCLLAACFALYTVGVSIYYITLHPLASIPGPKICGITRIPYWLVAVKGEDVKWMKGLHDKYGPVVRFGPTDVSYATAEAWNDINGRKDSEKAQEFSVQPVNGKKSNRHMSGSKLITVDRRTKHAYPGRHKPCPYASTLLTSIFRARLETARAALQKVHRSSHVQNFRSW